MRRSMRPLDVRYSACTYNPISFVIMYITFW